MLLHLHVTLTHTEVLLLPGYKGQIIFGVFPDCCAEKKKKTSTVRLHDGACSCRTADRFLPKTVRFCLWSLHVLPVHAQVFAQVFLLLPTKIAHQVT